MSQVNPPKRKKSQLEPTRSDLSLKQAVLQRPPHQLSQDHALKVHGNSEVCDGPVASRGMAGLRGGYLFNRWMTKRLTHGESDFLKTRETQVPAQSSKSRRDGVFLLEAREKRKTSYHMGILGTCIICSFPETPQGAVRWKYSRMNGST